jgi:alpha-amylase/alpha-mannosidase (GH57 family)
MVPLVAAAGFEWMATDELILAHSLGTTFGRDAAGLVDQPERLYRPYRVEAGGAQVACGFRDHMLSDLIGFVYAGWSAEAAADDFVAKLADAGRRGSAGGEDVTVFIILDGENAWEHFPAGGRPFLRALYQRLSDHPELQTVTMAEACRPASQPLHGIFPGSWIDANFYIWIGHPDDHRGWSQLADARDVIDRAPAQVDPTVQARAKEELFIAEGSDWFWWYGDDHSSNHDLEFDDLFRRHLRNVYRLLGQAVPDELFTTNISVGADGPAHVDPIRLVTPIIDGEDSSYFEWLGTGTLDTREVAGAMHQTTREALMVGQVRFGFDRRCLYVRMDGVESPLRERADRGYTFSLVFLQPAGIRITLGREGCAFYRRPAPTDVWQRTESTATGAIGRIAELSVPLQELQADTDTLSLFIAVHDRHGVEIERHPAIRLLELTIPTDSFEATHWSA